MSVAKLRSSFDKKGCQIFLWIVMVGTAVGLAGAGFLGVFSSKSATQNPTDNIVVFTVDDRDATLTQVLDATTNAQNEAQSQAEQQGQPAPTGPSAEFKSMGNALLGLIDTQVIANMAAAQGATVNDDKAVAMASDQIDQFINSIRQQGVTSGKLKTTSTEKEFQDYFKDSLGVTAADYKSQRIDYVKQTLADDSKREAFLAQFSQQLLRQQVYNKTTVTDEEVKKAHDSLMVKIITFSEPGKTDAQHKADADKALKELDAGADFDKVAAKYVKNPMKDPQPYDRTIVEKEPALKPLADLKPGQHTGVISNFFNVPAIFKLVEVKSDLPKDYEKNMALYNDDFRHQKADEEFAKEVDAARKKAKIVWKIHGYEMIYTLFESASDPASTKETNMALFKKVSNDDNLTDDPSGEWPGALARYIAIEQLNLLSTPDEQKALLEKRADIIQRVLSNTESVSLRLTLVDIFEKLGDKQNMENSLLDAATYNTGVDLAAAQSNEQITATLIRLQNEKKIDDDVAKQINQRLIDWNKQKALDEQAKKAQAQYASDLDKYNITPPAGDQSTVPPAGTTGGTTGG
ncbi:MAG TPA: hypothetical protein VNI20_06215 [Fimbriimonadaceae bacterium]|nr:hypothetical protein [Fimbriimonadaceae bacterium]